MNVRHPSLTAPLILVVLVAFGLATTATQGAAAVVTTLTALMAAGASLLQAARRRGRPRLAWLSIGGAALCEAVAHGRPGTAAHLLMVVVVSVGMFAIPVPRRSAVGRIRALLDALLIAVSLLATSWNFVMHPMVVAGGTGNLAGPVADIVLGTVAILTIGAWHRNFPAARSLMLTGVSLFLLAFGDTLAAGLAVSGHDGWLAVPEALSFAAFALILLGAVHALTTPGQVVAVVESDVEEQRQLAAYLPYVAVLFALFLATFYLANGGQTTAIGTWSRFLSILLIVLRQVLLLVENRLLTRRLETRVAERAAELHEREQRFRALVEQSSDSLAVLEADSTVRYQSESIQRIFGYPASALLGRRFIELAGRRVGARVEAGIAEVLGTPGATTVFETMLRHGDGRYRMAEMTITNLLDDAGIQGLIFNTRDVSDARELQEQLHHEAYHDALTGLVNRALFRDRLATAVAGRDDTGEVAILFLDLDGFKEVNDSLGHAAGDHLLVQVAERLTECVGDPHTVARLGGDEFAVIVASPDARDDAEALAVRILAGLDLPFRVDGRDLHIGAGIGIASTAYAGDIEQLQRNADLAMYRAKDAGGGVYAAYHPSMHDALVQRLELATDLRLALERDELVLHYQPTVDLRTGEIIGFEALVRWMHPARGMVPPLDFIGVAESTGLIVPLGRWVLAEACRQAVAWGAGDNRQLKMAVNVSVRQFDAGDLAATVAEVLAETGMPADQLCLEMTESVLLTDTDENLTRILRLKALGVLLAMDDFGTGYSSLAYLRRFPMDVLKIDRSFVDRLGGESEDEALVRTIVRLGQRFGMTTVAEGIENATQLSALREMGCDTAQGYFLSRPVPAAEATLLLESGLPVTV